MILKSFCFAFGRTSLRRDRCALHILQPGRSRGLTETPQFEVTYAPWMLMQLPLTSPPAPHPAPLPTNPYIADPTPRSRLIHITHYGRPRALCAPVLAHAAILNFFARVDRLLGGARFQAAAGDLTGGMDGPVLVDGGGGEREGRTAEAVEAPHGNTQAGFRPRVSSSILHLIPSVD